MATSRSIIRWAGSKKRLLPQIGEYWSAAGEERRYVEPFAGSAAFLFHAKPASAAINDSNRELINALKFLKSKPSQIYEFMSSSVNSAEEYYRVRSQMACQASPFQRACNFFYLNRYCFNGIFRVNKMGHFNVPYGGERSGGVPPKEAWLAASSVLKNVEIHCSDFEKFCRKEIGSNDFVYLDPPYAVSNRRIFSQYGMDSFGLNDMERMSVLLRDLDARGAKFLVSYARSPESRILSRDWKVRRVHTKRNVAGFREHRRMAVEVMISNF